MLGFSADSLQARSLRHLHEWARHAVEDREGKGVDDSFVIGVVRRTRVMGDARVILTLSILHAWHRLHTCNGATERGERDASLVREPAGARDPDVNTGRASFSVFFCDHLRSPR